MKATLGGNRYRPYLKVTFPVNATIPRGVTLPKYPKRHGRGRQQFTGRPRTILDWMRMVPGRHWDADEIAWIVTDPGPNADTVLRDLGFDVDLSRGAMAGIRTLADLAIPLIEPDEDDPYTTWLYPRFSSGGVTLPVGSWDKTRRAFAVHTPDLVAAGIDPRLGTPDTIASAARLLAARTAYGARERDAKLSRVLSRQTTRHERALEVAAERFGVLPDWFDVNLFGYQECGAYALISGHSLLGDPQGIGKTIQAVAAHTIVGTRRLLVTCPKKVRSAWAREFEKATVAYRTKFEGDVRDGAGTVVIIEPGRKLPALPDHGVVIVAHSYVASNSAARNAILAWSPDGLIVDEAHYLKTWDSDRSRAVRRIAQDIEGLRIASSGTVILKAPHEAMPALAITGHLDSVFGGVTNFLNTYCYQDTMGNWQPRMKALEDFRHVLDGQVWVRRDRDEAYEAMHDESGGAFQKLTFAPPRPIYVEVDLHGFTAAHKDIEDRVGEWLDELGREPTLGERDEWASENVGLVSVLRRAAGMAKVPAAVDYIQTWLEDGPNPDTGLWDDPLLVWTHHRDVTEAMIAAVADVDAPVQAIWGGGNDALVEAIVDDFQAGRTAVIVASVHAAGTGLTLTRARHALWVESDWTPGVVQQSADRIRRIGQTRDVDLAVMIAEGTLDERIQQTLAAKARVLDPVLGDGNDISVALRKDGDAMSARDIVLEIVNRQVRSRRDHNRPVTTQRGRYATPSGR